MRAVFSRFFSKKARYRPRLSADTNSERRRRAFDFFDEVRNMSPKELLYIEDALGHTQYLMTQCRTAASQLTDPVLRGEAQRMVAEHQKLFTSFYNLV
jgi:hypothetical protein